MSIRGHNFMEQTYLPIRAPKAQSYWAGILCSYYINKRYQCEKIVITSLSLSQLLTEQKLMLVVNAKHFVEISSIGK